MNPADSTLTLDPRLENDTVMLARLALCDVRVMNDNRWPWLVLVPRIDGASEIHDLSADDQAMLHGEISRTATVLQTVSRCEKINIGALGNIVRQLHVHVVARSTGDANWPGPVWGFGSRVAYMPDALSRLSAAVQQHLD